MKIAPCLGRKEQAQRPGTEPGLASQGQVRLVIERCTDRRRRDTVRAISLLAQIANTLSNLVGITDPPPHIEAWFLHTAGDDRPVRAIIVGCQHSIFGRHEQRAIFDKIG